MEGWIEAVRSGGGVDEVFPVKAPADEEHAAMLETRLAMLRSDIIPAAESSDHH